ncbi:MAG TPA: hypothetical protein V6D26_23545 [Stenomitos sp.]
MNVANGDALSGRWDALQQGQILSTPSQRKSFEISNTTSEKITIKTEGETEIGINRAAFLAALAYLRSHNHSAASKVKIGSNKVYELASPLCRAIRDANGVNIMVSTYVIPILAEMGFVGVDCSRPNRTWFI